MAYQALAVANEFIHIARGNSLSPMKLQKLVYYAHGWHLALRDKPLIREDVEAWQFGPVIPELYREFKHYGDGSISSPSRYFNYEPRVDNSDEAGLAALEIINGVWKAYGSTSATKLSNATHKAGTPWSEVYVPGVRSLIIPDDLIKRYFKSL